MFQTLCVSVKLSDGTLKLSMKKVDLHCAGSKRRASESKSRKRYEHSQGKHPPSLCEKPTNNLLSKNHNIFDTEAGSSHVSLSLINKKKKKTTTEIYNFEIRDKNR